MQLINKYMPSHKVILLILVAAAFCSLPSFLSPPPLYDKYFFEVTVQPNKEGAVQIYWDTGRGYNESDSARKDITNTSDMTVCRLGMPTGTYQGLRLDPIDNDKPVLIAYAKILSATGEVIQEFTADSIHIEHDITRHLKTDKGILFEPTVGSSDPYLILELPGQIKLPLGLALFHRITQAVPIFLLILLTGYIISIVPFQKFKFRALENRERWLAACSLILALAKLWLVSGQTVFAIGGAGHDDQLFVNLAHSLLGGRWLGDYSQFTLMKGPMYSLFMAGMFLLNIPVFTGQHLLYALACWLLVRALKPLISSCSIRGCLFTVLLFNPITYDANSCSRVQRQDLLPALVFAILAGLIGMYARPSVRKRWLAAWSLLTGISLGVFWLTREEGIWLVLGILLLWAAALVSLWRAHTPDFKGRLVLLASPALVWALMVGSVAYINYCYYGVFTTCEFRHADFKAAYGALTRVKPKQWRAYIPIQRETREQIYTVSPSFAELKPFLEGSLGEAWADASKGLTGLPPAEKEIAGGWFMWALRDAVASTGHCHSGKDAMAYYAQVAKEINAACDQGKLEAGPKRSGFSPEMRRETIDAFFRLLPRTLNLLLRFERLSPVSIPSVGAKEHLVRFSDITRNRLTPREEDPPIPSKQRWLDNLRIRQLTLITAGYQHSIVLLGALALFAFFAGIILCIARKRLVFHFIVSLACLLSIGAIVAAVTLIDASSFPAIDPAYLTGAYGLWLLFIACSYLGLSEILRSKPVDSTPNNAL